jgi:hypothetical protein
MHGLLTSEYKISTDMNTLSAGLRVFGSSITGFLADERYFPETVFLPNLHVILPVSVKLVPTTLT